MVLEMDRCTEHGVNFPESGDLFKIVGILRAFDLYWNKDR